MPHQVTRLFRFARVLVACGLALASMHAADATSTRVEELLERNRQLQEQVREQQKLIDNLSARMSDVLRASERHERELRGLQQRVDIELPAVPAPGPGATSGDAQVRVSAEAGLAFFRTGRDGQFPESTFRVDDPVITFEAPVAKNVYFYSELKLLPRETNEEKFQLGEMYVDFEGVLSNWGRGGLLNARAGRLNIPFGEEYMVRGPVANPLISHSLSDIWGCDEGVEIYGRVAAFNYVVAVQNGGVSRIRDFNSDKSITGRISWDPARWLHVSGSAMRTGRLATVADNLSEVWFGNGFFRALGNAATTPTFWANLVEFDAVTRWQGGKLGVTLGEARFDDADSRVSNARRLRYGSLELVQAITGPVFTAARYSAIGVPNGYPLVGWAPMGAYFFRPGVLTENLKRMSVGLGYRFGPPLVLKAEYAWEIGRLTSGVRRDREDFFGTELGVKF